MNVLQVLQAPSKVPSACLSFCSYKPLPSACFLILPPFSHMFSTKSNWLGFLQIGRSTKSKSHLFTSGPPTSALQNQALRSQAKILLKSYEYIKTFEGFLKISRPLKILRAKISGMPGASSKFQKPRTLELIK